MVLVREPIQNEILQLLKIANFHNHNVSVFNMELVSYITQNPIRLLVNLLFNNLKIFKMGLVNLDKTLKLIFVEEGKNQFL